MAKSKKMVPGTFKKSKTSPVAPILSDIFIPKTATEAIINYGVPYGKAFRAVSGITKKGAKFVNKVYRNIGR